ncbi:MAG: VWA domain-containing protein [Cyanobacteria bacterium P01_F01_bin.150]
MLQPNLHIIPLRAAIPAHQSSILDVLVRVVPPEIVSPYSSASEERLAARERSIVDDDVVRLHHRLNLSLVIDRSSSMASQQRLLFAKAAARHIVQHLSPHDRVSVVTFDRHPQVLVPSTFVDDPVSIIQTIQGIKVGKWTNLHGGWIEGGEQINRHIYPDTVNRIILLTDGWVSAGVKNRSTIISHVQEMAQVGITTTSVGVGNRYNEDLLEAIAIQGDGNYYYINTPSQLPKAFEREMLALIATVGQQVTLDIQPQGDVEIEDVLNDLELTRQGRFKLPNLVSGFTFNLVMRLKVPAIDPKNTAEYAEYVAGRDTCNNQARQRRLDYLARLCQFRLHWQPVSAMTQLSRHQAIKTTLTLPLMVAQQIERSRCNPDVEQNIALMLAARLKRQAMALADRKDYDAAQVKLQKAKAIILNTPQSQSLELEVVALEALETDLRSRQLHQFRKRSHHESYQASTGFDQQSGILGYGDRSSFN